MIYLCIYYKARLNCFPVLSIIIIIVYNENDHKCDDKKYWNMIITIYDQKLDYYYIYIYICLRGLRNLKRLHHKI